MAEIIKTTFQVRRGYEAAWEKNNPVLACGEPGFVIDKNALKIGDGVTAWKDLGYVNEPNQWVFNADTHLDFPSVGSVDVIYKARAEKKIYQWNPDLLVYEVLGEAAQVIENNKYEIFSKPEGTLVNIKEEEIRIMCPNDTEWQLQNSGAGANANAYYIGFKAYAPNEEIYSFKEDLNEFVSDDTMYYFENNEFAGADENGRKYSIVWLPVALYNQGTQTWTYYGANSTDKRYIGWYYSVEWYNKNGVKVASDCVRINLSNENCHNIVEPYYMGSINVNKLVQNDNEFLILYGGSASDNV